MQKIGFIGVGNMGGALAAAVCKTVEPQTVFLADTAADKMKSLADALCCHTMDSKTVAETCDYIFFGVKPQMLATLFEEIGEALRNNPKAVLISMAAGIPLERLEALAGEGTPVIRIMPNTPVSVGEGMIVYTLNRYVSDESAAFFRTMLSAAGVLQEIPEALMDAACAVSGCGPAFVYMFIDALINGGVKSGLPRETARQLSVQTVLGAARLLLSSDKQPDQLKEAVCSPAGSTIEGVHTLEAAGFYDTVAAAVEASYKRAVELGKA